MDNLSFLFGLLVGFAAMPIFWVAFVLVVGLLWTSVVWEKGGWSSVLTIGFGALLVARFPSIIEYITWWSIGLSIPIYLAIGVLWARFKWSRFLSTRFDMIKERRDTFLQKRGLTLEYLKTLTRDTFEQLAPLEPQFQDVGKSPPRGGKTNKDVAEEYSNMMSGLSVGVPRGSSINEINEALIPQASHNKGSIVMWISYWPLSVVWYIISDIVKDIATGLYKMVGGNFQRMSDAKFKEL